MNRFDSIHRDMNTNKHGNMHGDMYGKRASKDVLFGIAGYGADKVLLAVLLASVFLFVFWPMLCILIRSLWDGKGISYGRICCCLEPVQGKSLEQCVRGCLRIPAVHCLFHGGSPVPYHKNGELPGCSAWRFC